jgi:hypothetical protein
MSVKEDVNLMRRWFKSVWNDGKTQTIHEFSWGATRNPQMFSPQLRAKLAEHAEKAA